MEVDNVAGSPYTVDVDCDGNGARAVEDAVIYVEYAADRGGKYMHTGLLRLFLELTFFQNIYRY